jgi:hypothetical protein
MKVIRYQPITRIFSLLTGVIFLNMSFFLVEVGVLDLKDKEMIENVCKLVLNGGLEEERDGHGGGSDAPVKLLTFLNGDALLHHSSLFLIAAKIYQDSEDLYLHANHSEKYSPPPECFTCAS